MTELTVRRLTLFDTKDYRRVRLHGLLHDPIAFTGCHAEESLLTIADFAARIEKANPPSAIFGAFQQTDMVGTVAFDVPSSAKLQHKATLWGMYTMPVARGQGVGRALMYHLLAYAQEKTEIEHILLSVTRSNRHVSQWYEKIGFRLYGIERNAVKFDTEYHDDELRVLFLSR